MHQFDERLLCSELSEAFAVISRARELHSHWLLKQHGLTDQQLAILRLIRDSTFPCVQHLARKLHIATATATGILDRLVSKQLIREHSVPEDRRKRAFSHTATGLEALKPDVPLFSPRFTHKLREVAEWEARMMARGLKQLADLMSPPSEGVLSSAERPL